MSQRKSLSVVVITKNEEKNIRRCLSSVSWANEIIVVDSGSTDETVQIARDMNAKVIERHWPGDGPQKYFAISQATCDWCLLLDADEELSDVLIDSIKVTLINPQHTFYKMQRHSYFLGCIMYHGDWGRDWIVRLFDRTKHQWMQDMIHPSLDVSKRKAAKLRGILNHYTQNEIYQSLIKLNEYSSANALMLFNNNKKTGLLSANLHKNWAFFRTYILRRGFLDGRRGYILAKLIGYGAYFKYIKLWEKNLNSR